MPRARRRERMSTRKIEDERKQIDLFECWELKEDAAVGGFYDSEVGLGRFTKSLWLIYKEIYRKTF